MRNKLESFVIISVIIRLVIEITYIPVNYEQFTISFDTLWCFIDPRCGTTANFLLIFPSATLRLFNILLIPVGFIGVLGIVMKKKINDYLVLYLNYVTIHYVFFGYTGAFQPYFHKSMTLIEEIQTYGYHITTILIILFSVLLFIVGNKTTENRIQQFTRKVESKKIRFINYLIDFTLIFILTNGFYYGLLLNHFGIDYLYVFIIGKFLYYFISEMTFKQTIGKLITGTKVSKSNSTYFIVVFLRTISRHIPFEPFSFLNENAYGWHDRFSNSRLLKK